MLKLLLWAHDKMNSLGVPEFVQAVIVATVLIASAAGTGWLVVPIIQSFQQ